MANVKMKALIFLVAVSITVPSCMAIEVLSSEVFILPLTDRNFSLPTTGVSYRPSLLNMPDLPSWLHFTFSSAAHTGFLYGVPPSSMEDVQVEVIATDHHTYETSRRVFDLDVVQQSKRDYEVSFKITNLNVNDLLVSGRAERLKSVLEVDLWKESSRDLVMTSLMSATQHGDRLPLKPDDKEGVYVSFGSSQNFSAALLQLEKEVEPLWHHIPCPTYFKKTSYERFFRQKSFAIDWCSFKLTKHFLKKPKAKVLEKMETVKSAIVSPLEDEGRIILQRRSEVVKRSYVLDVIHTILIPLVVMVVLLTLLSLAMCCHRANMDQQSSDFFEELFDDFPRPVTQDIQMVHYASVHRATEALRSLRGGSVRGGRDQSPYPSTATTTSLAGTLPHSRTASPSSTLPRTSTPSRRFEDYATLARPDPPPYQRNGTTPIH